MPPGEDPDTLVRTGGAAALEPLIKDAVDVVERKLQLLERRGYFEGVERRREALDRLLPTIRAASDPIARDLYLTRVSERVGVSRGVLEQELTARPATQAPRHQPRAAPPVSVDRARPPRTRGPRRFGIRTEAQLLRLLIADREWLERARADIAPERFSQSTHREIFLALVDLPKNAALDHAFAQVSPEAREVWQRLSTSESLEFEVQNADQVYAGAVQRLASRDAARAAPPVGDIEARKSFKAGLPPEEAKRWQWQKQASRDPARDPDARSEG
jgi:DNA primase